MKKLVLTVALVTLLAVAVFGGQALASSKPVDVTVSEDTSEIIFDWGGSYWGSPAYMKSFEGCFNAQDYPDGFSDYILQESYPEIRHVSLTISARMFDTVGEDNVGIDLYDCSGERFTIDNDFFWPDPSYRFETFEFNTDHWHIYLDTAKDSTAQFHYAVTVTYPR
jgi:hypothetical protein